MKIIYDQTKNDLNIRERGLSFGRVVEIDWSHILLQPDERFAYGEARYKLYGHIDGRLHMVAFTMRDGMMRVISFRKANMREVRDYEKEKA